MSEPTLKDMHQAAAFLNAAFGDRVTGAHVEGLSWLLATVRDEQRRQTLDITRDCLAAGIPMGAGQPNCPAEGEKT